MKPSGRAFLSVTLDPSYSPPKRTFTMTLRLTLALVWFSLRFCRCAALKYLLARTDLWIRYKGWKSAGQRKRSFRGVDSYRSNASWSMFYLSCFQADVVDEDGRDLETRAARYSSKLGGKRKPRKGSEQARWV